MQHLKIESVQAKIQIQTTKASLQIRSSRPKLNVHRTFNGYEINSQPARIQISNRGIRESIYAMKPALSYMRECAENGAQAALEATAEIVEEGNALASPHATIAGVVGSSYIPQVSTTIAFIPTEGPEITVTPPKLDIKYTPDKIDSEWELERPDVNYTPYAVNISMVSYPSVKIDCVEDGKTALNPDLLKKQIEIFKEDSDI